MGFGNPLYSQPARGFKCSLYFCVIFSNNTWHSCINSSLEASWCLTLQFVNCSPLGEGNGTPLQYSCLENPMDGGAWWAAIYGVAQSRTRLKRLSSSSSRRWGEPALVFFLLPPLSPPFFTCISPYSTLPPPFPFLTQSPLGELGV